MEMEMLTKEHDEARQGESFSPDVHLETDAIRKFYIESYG